MGAVIDPDYQGEIRLLLHSGGDKEHVWDRGDPFKHLHHALWLKSMENDKTQSLWD